MSITTALHWRYATKRMNGNKIPLEILKKRYASGQIDKDKFHEMKKIILLTLYSIPIYKN